MDERGEVYVAGIKERAIYLYHQGLNGAEVDEFPYPEAVSFSFFPPSDNS